MKKATKLVEKEEKDGVIRTLTKVEEVNTYWIHEYFDKNTGSFGSQVVDEDGDLIDFFSGALPDIVSSALDDKKSVKKQKS